MSTETASPPPPGSVRIFRPPNRLKSKVGHGSPKLPATVPPTFQALMHASAAEYSKHLDQQIRELRELAAAGGALEVETVFTIAHQIRGEAKTFGFGCIGCTADSLCKFFEAGGLGRARSGAVVGLHVDTLLMLKTECDTRGEASAGTMAQALFDGLSRAVQHVLKPCDGADCAEIGHSGGAGGGTGGRPCR